jgi:hypothetical protein
MYVCNFHSLYPFVVGVYEIAKIGLYVIIPIIVLKPPPYLQIAELPIVD